MASTTPNPRWVAARGHDSGRPGAARDVAPSGVDTAWLPRSSGTRETRPLTIGIHEGSTVRDVARLLEAKGLARAQDVLRLNKDHTFLRRHGIEAVSLEGYLYPGTYDIAKGAPTEEIVARMVRRAREEVPDSLWNEAEAKGLTRHQVLTLASIIQKEAGAPREMPLISAVFWNRMNRGMPLQADPTVLYAVGKYRRRLTRRDLRVDSPFNTYRYAGLPPGPIANPGKAAILAALHPAEAHYYLYFAKHGRRNVFASTLRQHRAGAARPHIAEARQVVDEATRPHRLPLVPLKPPTPPAHEAGRVPAETVALMTNPGS